MQEVSTSGDLVFRQHCQLWLQHLLLAGPSLATLSISACQVPARQC